MLGFVVILWILGNLLCLVVLIFDVRGFGVLEACWVFWTLDFGLLLVGVWGWYKTEIWSLGGFLLGVTRLIWFW